MRKKQVNGQSLINNAKNALKQGQSPESICWNIYADLLSNGINEKCSLKYSQLVAKEINKLNKKEF